VSLARQVFGKNVCQHVIRSYEDCLDLHQLDGFSQVMDFHDNVSHLSSHRFESRSNGSLVVAECAGRLDLFAGDLVEQISKDRTFTSACDTAV
jgi:hypothetical protein